MFHLPDTLGPDVLVQTGVDAHVLGAHLLLGELADLLDGARRTLLVSDAVDQLGQVNGAFTGDHLVDGGLVAFLLLRLGHFSCRASGSCGHKNRSLLSEPLFSQTITLFVVAPRLGRNVKAIVTHRIQFPGQASSRGGKFQKR